LSAAATTSVACGRRLSEREKDYVQSPLPATVPVQRAEFGQLGGEVPVPTAALSDRGDADPPLAVQFDRDDSDPIPLVLQLCPSNAKTSADTFEVDTRTQVCHSGTASDTSACERTNHRGSAGLPRTTWTSAGQRGSQSG